ncbi:hypothetical protein NHX12_024951 [Muraenolepis orangiensis]|uniref:Uncharacterized protein n=1 Tax=Muraenolepis orangiensis TaxID=630683 RepID=A0A9Q0IRT5_9TELE|nr:hypothetical protein NHX12_024951 [Muraenolepis orangiensis]
MYGAALNPCSSTTTVRPCLITSRRRGTYILSSAVEPISSRLPWNLYPLVCRGTSILSSAVEPLSPRLPWNLYPLVCRGTSILSSAVEPLSSRLPWNLYPLVCRGTSILSSAVEPLSSHYKKKAQAPIGVGVGVGGRGPVALRGHRGSLVEWPSRPRWERGTRGLDNHTAGLRQSLAVGSSDGRLSFR